jgi:hypothetical protein
MHSMSWRLERGKFTYDTESLVVPGYKGFLRVPSRLCEMQMISRSTKLNTFHAFGKCLKALLAMTKSVPGSGCYHLAIFFQLPHRVLPYQVPMMAAVKSRAGFDRA